MFMWENNVYTNKRINLHPYQSHHQLTRSDMNQSNMNQSGVKYSDMNHSDMNHSDMNWWGIRNSVSLRLSLQSNAATLSDMLSSRFIEHSDMSTT